MLKIVKSSLVYNQGDAVSIDNTVTLPPPLLPEATEGSGEFIAQADIVRQQQEEQRKKREEEERIEAEISRGIDAIKTDLENKHLDTMKKTEQMRKDIISAANDEAAAIANRASQDAENLRVTSEKKGYDDGFKKGYDDSIAKCDDYVKTAAKFLSGVNQKKEAYFKTHEEALLEAVQYIVRKITMAELNTDKEMIFRILKQAAKKFKNDTSIKISFSGSNVSEELVTDLDFIRSIVGNIPEIEIEILTEAEEGTVIVDNGKEIIDASVPTQLDLLKEIMNNSRGPKQTSAENSEK